MALKLEISNIVVTDIGLGQPDQAMHIGYRLANTGHDEMAHGAAYVSAYGQNTNGEYASQSHWYEQPLHAGDHRDLEIHLQIDPGECHVTLQVFAADGTLITEHAPVQHVVPNYRGEDDLAIEEDPATLDFHVNFEILHCEDLGGGLKVHYRATNVGKDHSPLGFPLVVTAYRKSDDFNLGAQQHQMNNAIPGNGGSIDGALDLVLDEGDYRILLGFAEDSHCTAGEGHGHVA